MSMVLKRDAASVQHIIPVKLSRSLASLPSQIYYSSNTEVIDNAQENCTSTKTLQHESSIDIADRKETVQ